MLKDAENTISSLKDEVSGLTKKLQDEEAGKNLLEQELIQKGNEQASTSAEMQQVFDRRLQEASLELDRVTAELQKVENANKTLGEEGSNLRNMLEEAKAQRDLLQQELVHKGD